LFTRLRPSETVDLRRLRYATSVYARGCAFTICGIKT